MRIRNFVCLILLSASLLVRGQDAVSGFKNFRSLTIENGLPSNNVTCFAKDAYGFMWIGTTNGLARYDGSEVIVYQHIEGDTCSLSGNNIKALQMDGDSVMWVATATNGLSKFHFKTKNFTRYFPKVSQTNSLGSTEVISLASDRFGELWIGYHRDGFARYDRKHDSFINQRITNFEENRKTRQNNIVLEFIFDNKDPDIVWILTLYSLVRFEKSTEQISYFSPYENKDTKSYKTYSMKKAVQDEDGKIYVTFSRFGVWAFTPVTNSWKNYSLKAYNSLNRLENSFDDIAIKRNGTFWLTGHYKGLYQLSTDEGFIKSFDNCPSETSSGLCFQKINTFEMSEPEGYWIGTDKGVRLYNRLGNQFNTFTHRVDRKILQNRSTVTAIYQAPGDTDGVFYGGYAGEGVYYFDKASATSELIPAPANYGLGTTEEMFFARVILPLDDSLALVLSENGIFKLNTKRRALSSVDIGLTFQRDFYFLHRIFHHSNGNFYLSTRHNGIFVLNPELKCIDHLTHNRDDPNSLISPYYIYEICEDPEQRLWIGTEDGFSVYDPNTGTFDNFDYEERLDSIPQLKIILKTVCAADSSIWFIDARDHGVSIDYPYQKPFQFKPILTGANKLSERINNVFFSESGKTYITTASGLSIVETDGSIARYGQKEGLPPLRGLGPVMETSCGDVFIGAGDQLIYFNPKELHKGGENTSIFLTSFNIFNQAQKVNIDSLQEAGLTLSYKENFFSLKLSSINFDNPEEYSLSYRLAGLNDSWITDPDKKAVFTNIPGGRYTFEARLLNKNNQPQKEIFILPIEIIPPFWERIWFRVLIATVFVLIVLAFYTLRVRSIRREAALTTDFNKQIANMELTSLRAQMNPHFLFNSLNSIRHQIISNKKIEADRYLLKFSRLVRLILNNSRQQLIPLKDELEALALYIELESSRFEHKFDYDLNIDDRLDIESVKIPPIIIQPYVENAIWHGLMQKPDSGKVTIGIEKTDKNLCIKIHDDGVGREKAKSLKSKTAEKRQSMGLAITGNRLEIIEKIYDIRCHAEIIDLKGENGEAIGTLVILTLPLIYEN